MTEDVPICGYQDTTGLCRDPRDPDPAALRCTTHEQVQFKVCAGCAGFAHHVCGYTMTTGAPCPSSLCMFCIHRPDGTHGAIMGDDATGSEQPTTDAADVRVNLVEAVERSLTRLHERGVVTVLDQDRARAAAILVDDLAAHALLALLGGMAARGA